MANLIDVGLFYDKECSNELPRIDGVYYINIGNVSREAERLKLIKLYAKNVGSKNALVTEMASKHNTIDHAHTFKVVTLKPKEVVPFEIALDIKPNINAEVLEFCIRSQYVIKVFGSIVKDLQGIQYNKLFSNVEYVNLYILGTKRVKNNRRYPLKLVKRDIYKIKLKDGQVNKEVR